MTVRFTARMVIAPLVAVLTIYLFGRIFYTHVPESRRAASEVLIAVAPLQQDIAAAAMKRRSFAGAGRTATSPATIKTQSGSAAVTVADDGKITLQGISATFTLELTPYFEGTVVAWRCRATPESDAPLPCRSAR